MAGDSAMTPTPEEAKARIGKMIKRLKNEPGSSGAVLLDFLTFMHDSIRTGVSDGGPSDQAKDGQGR